MERNLALLRDADDARIDATYRRLALKYHPDKAGGSASKFVAITKAYEGFKQRRTVRTAAKPKRIAQSIPDIASPAFQTWLLGKFSGNPSSVDMRIDKRWKSPMDQLRAAVRVPAFDGCRGSPVPSLATNQAIIYLIARLRATYSSNGPITTGGILAAHSTGSGKTLIGVCCIVAFWDAKTPAGDPMPIVSVSTPTNQRDNSTEVFGKLALLFFETFRAADGSRPFWMPGDAQAMRAALLVAASNNQKATTTQAELERALEDGTWRRHPLFIEVASQRIAARLRVGMASLIDPRHLAVFRARARPGLYTFQKLANDARDVFRRGQRLQHALLIVDEFHYLNDRAMPGAEAVRKLLTTGRDPRTTWCVGMTATPGETRKQVVALLDAVAGRTLLSNPATDPIFPAARGLLSIARLESDGSRFARVKVSGMCARLDDRSSFSREYVRRVVGVFGGHTQLLANEPIAVAKKRKLADAQMRLAPGGKKAYMRTVREWTNFMELGGDLSGDDEHPGEYTVEMTQRSRGTVKTLLASPKIATALNHIKNKRGKHYVFSNSTRTLQILATLMQRELGMQHYNPSQCAARGGCRDPYPAPNPRAPAFITLDDIGTPSYKPFDALQPRTRQAVALRRHVMQAFDAPSNYYGDEIKVVLATKESFKGVDLKGVRYIHLMEPFVEFQDFIQMVGRGPRLCSHAAEPSVAKRVVDVFLYRLVPGKTGCGPATEVVEAADCFVYEHALARYLDTWGAIDDQLDKCAVDSRIFGPTLGAAYRAMFAAFKNIRCVFVDPLKITRGVTNPRRVWANRMERYAENGGRMPGASPPSNTKRNYGTFNNTAATAATARTAATVAESYAPPPLWEMFPNRRPTTAQRAREAERARKLRARADAARRKASPIEGYEPLYKMMERGKAGSANRARLARELAKVQNRVAKNRIKARKVSPIEGYEPLYKMMERGRAGSANKARLARELAKVKNRVVKNRIKARKLSPVEGYEPLYKFMNRKMPKKKTQRTITLQNSQRTISLPRPHSVPRSVNSQRTITL